jgi:hypothetical protein
VELGSEEDGESFDREEEMEVGGMPQKPGRSAPRYLGSAARVVMAWEEAVNIALVRTVGHPLHFHILRAKWKMFYDFP